MCVCNFYNKITYIKKFALFEHVFLETSLNVGNLPIAKFMYTLSSSFPPNSWKKFTINIIFLQMTIVTNDIF